MDQSAISIKDGTVIVDRSPEGKRQHACQTMSGEVFEEWGIINLRDSFPARFLDWKPEFPPEDIPDEVYDELDEDDPEGVDVTESHLVVPMRVEKRGFKDKRSARNAAERRNEDEPGGENYPYQAVLLSDMRGL